MAVQCDGVVLLVLIGGAEVVVCVVYQDGSRNANALMLTFFVQSFARVRPCKGGPRWFPIVSVRRTWNVQELDQRVLV